MIRAPALHFAVVGVVLYALVTWFGPEPAVEDARVVLEISRARLEAVRGELVFELGRAPTRLELDRAIDQLVTDEILLRHALDLGLDRERAVEHRLAQVATFVETGPVDGASPAERADQARALGLHRSDQVVRNILLDRVARLIRAAVLAREPDDATLAAYLAEHAEAFQRPPRIALVHVEVRTGDHPRAAAERLLDALTVADPEPAAVAAGGWGDPPSVPAVLPPLTERELARRLGHGFVLALVTLPDGTWAGPVPSRYGWHLVRLQREPADGPPSLDAVRDDVRARVRHEWAESWFAARLEALRAGYLVRVAAVPSTPRDAPGGVGPRAIEAAP